MGGAISDFSFGGSAADLYTDQDFVATIRSGLDTRERLFESLSQQVQFPDYFGENWDALSECLRDLCWIKARRVVMVHQDLPPLPSHTLAVYLDVLSECVRDWEADEAHELVVVFPEGARRGVSAVLSEEGK